MFLSEMSGETYLTDDEKEAIYQICKEFDEYASENKFLSDNDYALKVIRQAAYQIKRTNCIIIDEFHNSVRIVVCTNVYELHQKSSDK